jgi:hypothetical protein
MLKEMKRRSYILDPAVTVRGNGEKSTLNKRCTTPIFS